MPRPRRHFLDDLADELFDWIQEEIDALTLAFQAGGRSPFAAPVSEDQKLAFYTRAFFNKDGVTPNEAGRKATLARIGVDQYVQVMKAVTHSMQGGLPENAEPGEMPAVPEPAEGEAP